MQVTFCVFLAATRDQGWQPGRGNLAKKTKVWEPGSGSQARASRSALGVQRKWTAVPVVNCTRSLIEEVTIKFPTGDSL
jgi:hypothetical protein